MPRSTIHHFPLNLADPRTRGWGGMTLGYKYTNMIGCIIVGFLLFIFMYDNRMGPFFTAIWGIWIPLWLFTIFYFLRHDAYIGIRLSPKSRVICDPRGITCHNVFGRIQYQWRWNELKAVEYQRQPQRALRITPLRGTVVIYRSGRLDYADYRAIVETAQQYLSGKIPALPATPSVTVNHIWYERWDMLSDKGINVIYWGVMLFVFCSQPATLRAIHYWPEKWEDPPPAMLNNLYPFLVIGFILLDLFLIYHIIRRFLLLCAATAHPYAAIDKEGLSFYHPGGKVLKLLWQDIRSIDTEHVKYTHDRFDMKIVDRLGHIRYIGGDSGEREPEIVDAINNLLSGGELTIQKESSKNTAYVSDVFLFFLNTLLGFTLALEEFFYTFEINNVLILYRDSIFNLFVFLMLGLNLLTPGFGNIGNFRRK
jgi:hypothetical protein